MATESTAIHDLLSGFNRKAIPDDPDDDVLFAGSRRRDGETAPKQPSHQPRAGMFTQPPPPPAPPMDAGSTPAFAAPPARMPSGTQPPPYAHTVIPSAPGVPTMQLNVSPQLVVPLPQAFVRHPAHAIQEAHATIRVSKSSAFAAVSLNKKLYAIPVALFVIAVVLAAVLLTSGDKSAKKVAAAAAPVAEVEAKVPAAPAAAVVAATPVAAAAPVVAPTPVNKDVIAPPTVVPESTFTAKHEPTFAAVTATPIDAPKAAVPTAVVAAVSAAPKAAVPAVSKVKKSKRELARERRAARAAKRAKPRVAVADKPAKAEKSEKAAKAGTEDLNGNGALAITSSSPREVWVDGKNSKRMTPLRVLLKPGKHKVTLFDKDHGSAKTFEVEIKPDATTKISK